MNAADLSPVPESQRTQSAFDLFLIFAAANVVATTLQTGAVLGSRFGAADVMPLVVGGSLVGAVLVALLAPVGSRSGVPSMIAARAPLGRYGAGLVAALLYLTNFAWIAINNTIAASVCAQVLGGSATTRWWAAALGVAATAVVARGPPPGGAPPPGARPRRGGGGGGGGGAAPRGGGPGAGGGGARGGGARGPRAGGRADRVAVPMMVVAGAVLTWAAFTHAPAAPGGAVPGPAPSWLWGLDVIIGYQVSWLLMFADYSRYTRSPRASQAAVFGGLALPALWLMPVGWTLARIAGSADPGAMLAGAGVGWWTAALVALATVTTNFVNIYLSSLAWRSLVPRASSGGSVWAIGLIGTALGLVSSAWLLRFADLMLLLGSVLVPVGGVFLAHFVVLRRPVDVEAVYDPARLKAFSAAGMTAWIAGAAVYRLAAPIGATLPALATAMLVYVAVEKAKGEK